MSKRGKGAARRREITERLDAVTNTPTELKQERHSRNVQLFQHGICVSGNRLINSILNQIYAPKSDNPGDNVCQHNGIVVDVLACSVETHTGDVVLV